MSRLATARAALVGANILLPLLVLEAALRVAGPIFPGNYDTGSYLSRHPRYGHYHPASYDGWIRRDEFTVQVRTNGEGQRGPAVPFERAPNTFRILVVGDSFVEAVQVAEHERFLARLEQSLNPPGAAIRVELIDGGCGGWGTAQEYLYLLDEGPRYRPDLVLLAFFVGNDVANNSLDLELDGRLDLALKPYYRRTAGGTIELLEPQPPPPTVTERIAAYFRARSAVYNVIETGVLQKLSLDDHWAALRDLDALVETRTHDIDLYRPKLDDRWREAWTITETLVGYVGRAARDQGSRAAMIVVPTREQVVRQAWRDHAGRIDNGERVLDAEHPNAMLRGIAERASMPMLDLLPGFKKAAAARGAPQFYFARDQHWTAAGHALAAESIAGFLRAERLLPEGVGTAAVPVEHRSDAVTHAR